MEEEKLGKLLNELAEQTAERVRPGLAEEVKQHIPEALAAHRRGMDTISIMIDLRVSKLAAAAAIIITMILLGSFFGGRDSTGNDIYHDSMLLIKHCLMGEDARKRDALAATSKLYEYLLGQGKEAVYYGDCVDPEDRNAVLMQWKLSEGKYKVIFSDLHEEEVSAEELIKLQARMLQKRK
jgi:hypothetical protein